ncbi:hypothetical protein OBE_05066, partial [human gut metagenome]
MGRPLAGLPGGNARLGAFHLLSRRLVRRKIGFYGTATAFLLLVLT